MGDERTYENMIAIRAVAQPDGMTADWAQLPYEVLGRMSNRIINEVRGSTAWSTTSRRSRRRRSSGSNIFLPQSAEKRIEGTEDKKFKKKDRRGAKVAKQFLEKEPASLCALCVCAVNFYTLAAQGRER